MYKKNLLLEQLFKKEGMNQEVTRYKNKMRTAYIYYKQRQFYFIIGIALILSIIRLYLYYKATYSIDMTANYDDQLLIHYAKNLLNGHWLGEYNTKTLSKGISYSLFLAFANKIHVPYSILLGGFNIFASGLITLSLRPIVKKSSFLFFVYLYFLFSPIGFTHEYSTRIYRNAIVIPAVMIIVACLLGIYYRKYRSAKEIFPWFCLLAFMFPFYWYIREDSIWLLPFVSLALMISFVQMMIGSEFKLSKDVKKIFSQITLDREKITKLCLFVLPLLSFMMANQFLKHKNEEIYDLAVVNDRSSGEFAQLMKNLIRLDDGTEGDKSDSRIWVSHEALNKALAVSPTFAKEAARIKELYTTHAWTQAGKVKELKGDIIFWALRDVISESGYYKNNAKETNEFWKNVNHELVTAYKNGELKKKKEVYLMGTGDGKVAKDVPVLLDFFRTAYSDNLFYRGFYQGGNFSYGTHEAVEEAQNLLRVPLLNHWVNSEDPQTPVLVLSKTAKISNFIMSLYQKTSGLILILAALGSIFLILGSLFAKNDRKFYCSAVVITSGLIATQLLFLFGVSWFCSYSPEQKDYFLSVYTGAGVPIMQTAIVIILLSMNKISWGKIHNKIKKSA